MNLDGSISSIKEKRSKKDEWVVRIIVDDVSGTSKEGMTLVRGQQVHVLDNDGEGDGEGDMVDTVGEVKVVLAGEGAGTGLQKGIKVELGKTVGIKGPLWEVLIEGERWGVGLDWKVLA